MVEPLLSIVVPVYNVSAVVAPLAAQLAAIAATESVELVFVGDGSKDDSMQIVHAHTDGLARVTIVEQANAGLSAARNRGLQAATGDYVWFVDSDDLLDQAALGAMLQILKQRHPDLMQFGFTTFTTTPQFTTTAAQWATTDGATLFAQLAEDRLENYAWLHLARRRLYHEAQISFPEGLLFEDMATSYQLFLASKTVLVTDKPIYGYRTRQASIVNTISEQSMQDLWQIAQLVAAGTAQVGDRQHASQLAEMAQLIALGRTMEGAETAGARALRRRIVSAYLHTHWEHHGKALIKTRIRQLLMRTNLYVPMMHWRIRTQR